MLAKKVVAGVLGFEPSLKVLETLVLAIDTTPPQKNNPSQGLGWDYLVSLCIV